MKKNKQNIRFGALEDKISSWKDSRIAILPVAYDLTTSYKPGTINGPKAIIDASRYMEAYDEETEKEISKLGIYTFKEIRSSKLRPEDMIKKAEKKISLMLDADKFPVLIGGEHSITLGPVLSCKKKFGNFSVLQLDAHSDMRDIFQGRKHSHGCIARRITEITDVVQIGIRSLSKEEAEKGHKNLKTFFMKDMIKSGKWAKEAIGSLKEKKVYVTIDMDVFDPSIMPSVGTPEPGGMGWYETLALLKRLSRKKEIIGFDAVELAPMPGNVSPDFLAAKLVYKFLNYIFVK